MHVDAGDVKRDDQHSVLLTLYFVGDPVFSFRLPCLRSLQKNTYVEYEKKNAYESINGWRKESVHHKRASTTSSLHRTVALSPSRSPIVAGRRGRNAAAFSQTAGSLRILFTPPFLCYWFAHAGMGAFLFFFFSFSLCVCVQQKGSEIGGVRSPRQRSGSMESLLWAAERYDVSVDSYAQCWADSLRCDSLATGTGGRPGLGSV